MAGIFNRRIFNNRIFNVGAIVETILHGGNKSKKVNRKALRIRRDDEEIALLVAMAFTKLQGYR